MHKTKPVLVSIALLAAVLLIQIFFLLVVLPNLNFASPETNIFITWLAIDFSFVVGIILAIKVWGISILNHWNMPSDKNIYLVFLIAAAAFVIYPTGDLVYFIKSLINDKLDFFKFQIPDIQTKDQYYLYFKVIILGPIYEELFYRKIILSKLKEGHSLLFSIFLSSILFSLGHLDFENFIQLFFIGALYGYVYVKSNSIICSILLHSLLNIFVSLTTNFVVDPKDAYYLYSAIFIISFLVLYFGVIKMETFNSNKPN